MIIGLAGPVFEDITEVIDLLTADKNIQVVDTTMMMREASRKIMSSLTTQEYHQRYFLRKLEDELGTVIVSGNLIVTEPICQRILENGGIVVIVSRKDMKSYPEEVLKKHEKYWEDSKVQYYNLVNRFQAVYDRLSKYAGVGNLFRIDLSDDNSEDLDSLIENSQDWLESTKAGLSNQDILDLTSVRKDGYTMTLEESIKKAMRELGMEVEGDDEEQVEDIMPKPEPPKEKPKKQVKPVEKKKPQPVVKKEPEPQPEPMDEEEDNGEESDAVFVKISGGTMALLIPADLKLEKQSIGGMEFNVATIAIPDLNKTTLQELPLAKIAETKPVKQEIKRVPIITDKKKAAGLSPAPKPPAKKPDVSGDLEELQEEKARLDAEIKKYRSLGDIETVNELRKQRRAVRNKINQLK